MKTERPRTRRDGNTFAQLKVSDLPDFFRLTVGLDEPMTPLQFEKKLTMFEKEAQDIVIDVRLAGRVREHLSALIAKATALHTPDPERIGKMRDLIEKLQRLQFRFR